MEKTKAESYCRKCMEEQDYKRTPAAWTLPMRILNGVRYHLKEKIGEKYPHIECSECHEKFKTAWVPEGSKYDYNKLTFSLK